MSVIFKFWFIGSPLRLGFGNLFRGQAPTSLEVSRELHKILGDNLFKFLDRINFDIKSLFVMTRDPVMVLIIISLVIGGYFLFCGLAPYIRNESIQHDSFSDSTLRKSNSASNNIIMFFQQALSQSGAGDYRQAIISLHKATVEYLTTKVITSSSGKKYSNNDFKKKLKKDSNLYHPFVLIANCAEIAGFSSAAVSQSDFTKAMETFEKHFL